MQIERASRGDLTTLATDHGPVPMNIAAALVIDGGSELGLPAVRHLLEQRLPRVPRLRQRIVHAPLGHGRPVWVDDADALHAEFRARGVTIAREICDQLYGCRDFDVEDCNGFRLCFGHDTESTR